MSIQFLFKRTRRPAKAIPTRRRLVFEGCESRELLSGGGLGVETPLFSASASAQPESLFVFDSIGDSITISGDWWDKDAPTQYLKLEYSADGAMRFTVITSAAESYFNRLDGDVGSTAAELSFTDNLAVTQILPEPVLPALPSFPLGVGNEPGKAGGIEASETPLRMALASLDAGGESVASSRLQSVSVGDEAPASPDSRRGLAIGPADRVRFEQGTWDRAWAFEMAGFAKPDTKIDANQESLPHFESAFRQFPAESGGDLNGEGPAGVDSDGAQQRVSAAASTPTATGQGIKTHRTDGQRPAAPAWLQTSQETAAEAVDLAMADVDLAQDTSSGWWGAAVGRHKELTATVVAAVIVRQAWLHAKPSATHETHPDDRPRRSLFGVRAPRP